jgi:NADPH:quinone reductase-like Zn-dependent oxidoreductase
VGISNFGGWCERLPLTAGEMAVIPDSLSFAAAATLPVAGLTALRTLRLGGLLVGRRVLVQGAAGGVGRFALQMGRMAGARLTAVVGSSERGEGLRDLGADEVVVGIENADGRYDLILENAGGASLGAALAKVAQYGTVVTFGNSAREPTTFNTSEFYFQSARLVGFFLLDPAEAPYSADLGYLAGLVAKGRLDPQIGLEASWREAARALRDLRERRLPGKAVLHLE